MTESEIKAAILKKLGARPDVRLCNNPVGNGWVGKTFAVKDGRLVSGSARRVKFGLAVGSHDLVGWTRGGHKRFISIEVKDATGRLRKEQRMWMEALNRDGHIAFVARSVAEAERKLEEALVHG